MLNRLLGSVRQYKTSSLLTPLFVVLEVALEVVIPLFMANLIDYGIDAGNMSVVWRTGGILIAAALLSLVFGVLAGVFAAKASAGFAQNLRKDMYDNVQTFSFANIDRFSTASLVTRLTTDVANVQTAYQMALRIAARSPIMLIFSLVMAFRVNSRLSLIFLAIIPVLGLGLYAIMSGAHPVFERVFRSYDKLNNVVQENLRGIRVVKSFVREDIEKEKFGRISQSIFADFSRAEKRLAFNMPLMQACMYACMLLISWIGARLIVSGSMSTGQLMSMITYAMQMLSSLMMLSMVFVLITISWASGERIVEVLEEKPDLKNPDKPLRKVADGSVEFKQVSFSYAKDPGRLCLKDINLSVESGQTVGIIGGTGSGKTTLIQLISRLYDATEGQVLVGGADTREYDLETLRQQVAVVLQKNVLFSGTIRENLRWGDPDATDAELERACRLAQADEFIRAFPDGYDTRVEQGGSNVSGGQKQRLCIARALLKKPKILILDDSTSAVDTRTDALIRRAFREEIPDTTKFIIAQRVSSVQDADQIVVMDGGRIDAVGSHEALLATNRIYQEVYHSQTKGGDFDDAA